PGVRQAERRAVAGDPPGRGHRPASQALDTRAGARVHVRELRGRRSARGLGDRALHGDPLAGAGLQDRPAQAAGTARTRRGATRREVRHPRVPQPGTARRRLAARRTRGEDRPLDRTEALTGTGRPCSAGPSHFRETGMNKAWLVAGALALAGCAAAPQDMGARESERLDRLVEEYFDRQLERNPVYATFIGDHRFDDELPNMLSPEFIAESHALEQEYLDAIRDIDRSALSHDDQLTWDVFKLEREWAVEGERFPDELMPISQFYSIPTFMAIMGSGQSAQPFRNVQDYENWLGRIDDFDVLMRQIEANLGEGIRRGVTLPKIIVERIIPQLDAHVVDDVTQSIFWQPIANMPEDIGEGERAALEERYREAISAQVVPAYRRLRDYLANEYLPAARDTVGLYALPNGRAWYDYRIKTNTTVALSADAIHDIGLAEVQRIRGEMEQVMREVGFKGTLAEWFEYVKNDDRFYFDNEEDLLEGYRAIEARMNEAVPKLFDINPKAGFEVRPVEAFRAASAAGASYQSPSPDGSRPGIDRKSTRLNSSHV